MLPKIGCSRLGDNRKLGYRSTMFAFEPDQAADPATRYAELHTAARALVEGESDAIANMANVAALIWQYVPDLNWAGFYRLIGDELVLGPFIGKPACLRIALGQGVCGAAARIGRSQCVPDVHAFPGHIACDAASRSELVVPVFDRSARVIAVLDLDSPLLARFNDEDVSAIERMIADIAPALS
jgi:GAF domain-containing protein